MGHFPQVSCGAVFGCKVRKGPIYSFFRDSNHLGRLWDGDLMFPGIKEQVQLVKGDAKKNS